VHEAQPQPPQKEQEEQPLHDVGQLQLWALYSTSSSGSSTKDTSPLTNPSTLASGGLGLLAAGFWRLSKLIYVIVLLIDYVIVLLIDIFVSDTRF